MKIIDLADGFYNLSTLTHEELEAVQVNEKPMLQYKIGDHGGAIRYKARLVDFFVQQGMERRLAEKIASTHPKICVYATDSAGWGVYTRSGEPAKHVDAASLYASLGGSPKEPIYSPGGEVIGTRATCPTALPKGTPTEVRFFRIGPAPEISCGATKRFSRKGNVIRWGDRVIDVTPRRASAQMEIPKIIVDEVGFLLGFGDEKSTKNQTAEESEDALSEYSITAEEIILLSGLGVEHWTMTPEGKPIPNWMYGLGNREEIDRIIGIAEESEELARQELLERVRAAKATAPKEGRLKKIFSLVGPLVRRK